MSPPACARATPRTWPRGHRPCLVWPRGHRPRSVWPLPGSGVCWSSSRLTLTYRTVPFLTAPPAACAGRLAAMPPSVAQGLFGPGEGDAMINAHLVSYLLPPASYLLPPTSYRLPPTAYRLPPTAYRLPSTAYRRPTSYLLLDPVDQGANDQHHMPAVQGAPHPAQCQRTRAGPPTHD